MKLEKGRKLKDIKVSEVSFVRNPATHRTFLFFKNARGEGAGVGGERQGIGPAKYCVCPKCGYAIKHEVSGEGKTEPCARKECPKCGTKMVGSDSRKIEKTGQLVCPKCGYRLDYSGRSPARKKCPKCGTIMQCAAKKSEGIQMLKDKHIDAVLESFEKEELEEIELEKEYKELLDEEMDTEQIEKAKKMPAQALNAIKAAFRTLNKWKEHLPSQLKSAVDLMAKFSSGKYPYPKPYKKDEDEEEDIEKAGKRISKFVSGEIWAAIKKLQALLPEDFKKELEAEDEEIDMQELLKAAVDAFKMTKEEDPEDKDAEEEADDSDPSNPVLEKLEELSKRLETVEKVRGLKKGIDTDGKDETDLSKDDEGDPWTSIDIGE